MPYDPPEATLAVLQRNVIATVRFQSANV